MSKRTALDMAGGPSSADSGAHMSVSPVDYQAQFSGWHNAHVRDGVVSSYHPKAGARLYNENMQSETYSMLDYYTKHPMNLEQDIIIFSKSMMPFITEKFATKFTDGNEVIWTEMLLNTHPIPTAARGTLSNNITVSRESNRMKLHFVSQGFLTDLDTYNLEGGHELFEAHVRAVASNFIHTVMLDAITKVRYAVFAYNNPENAMPDVIKPRTIAEADRIVRLHHNEISNQDLGIKKLATRAAVMFNAMDESIDGFMLGSDLYAIITTSDRSNNSYTYVSGYKAVSSRSGLTKPIEHKFYVIPTLTDRRSNDFDQMSLKIRHQAGSSARHVNCTVDMPPGKFRTRMTDFEKATWDKNGFVKFEKRDTLQHCLQFQACDYIKKDANPSGNVRFTPGGMTDAEYTSQSKALPGQLNRELIRDFINDYHSITRAVRTRSDTNMNKHMFSCVVRYDPSMSSLPDMGHSGDKTMMVAALAGEVDPVFAHADHIANICKTAGARLFKDFTKKQMDSFMWGIRWAEAMNETTVDADYGEVFDALLNKENITVGKDALTCDIESKRETREKALNKAGFFMCPVNKHGGVPTFRENQFGGFGNISGIFTIADEYMNGKHRIRTTLQDRNPGPLHKNEECEKLVEFVALYKRFARNALKCMPRSLLVDPRMCPYYHTSKLVEPFTRTCIVLWYGITRFLPPLYMTINPRPPAPAAAAPAAAAAVPTGQLGLSANPNNGMYEDMITYRGKGNDESANRQIDNIIKDNFEVMRIFDRFFFPEMQFKLLKVVNYEIEAEVISLESREVRRQIENIVDTKNAQVQLNNKRAFYWLRALTADKERHRASFGALNQARADIVKFNVNEFPDKFRKYVEAREKLINEVKADPELNGSVSDIMPYVFPKQNYGDYVGQRGRLVKKYFAENPEVPLDGDKKAIVLSMWQIYDKVYRLHDRLQDREDDLKKVIQFEVEEQALLDEMSGFYDEMLRIAEGSTEKTGAFNLRSVIILAGVYLEIDKKTDQLDSLLEIVKKSREKLQNSTNTDFVKDFRTHVDAREKFIEAFRTAFGATRPDLFSNLPVYVYPVDLMDRFPIQRQQQRPSPFGNTLAPQFNQYQQQQQQQYQQKPLFSSTPTPYTPFGTTQFYNNNNNISDAYAQAQQQQQQQQGYPQTYAAPYAIPYQGQGEPIAYIGGGGGGAEGGAPYQYTYAQQPVYAQPQVITQNQPVGNPDPNANFSLILPIVSRSPNGATFEKTYLRTEQLPTNDDDYLWEKYRHVPTRDAKNDIYNNFLSKDGSTICHSIIGALPFIDPRFPLIPFSMGFKASTEAKKFMASLGAKGQSIDDPQTYFGSITTPQFKDDYLKAMTSEEEYWSFQSMFNSTVPYSLAHLIYYPPTGNALSDTPKLSTMEKRWLKLETLSDQARIGGRIALFLENSLPALVQQCDEDIDTIFSAIVLSPWEEQLNHSIVPVAKGQLGTLYHNQKNDKPNEIAYTEMVPRTEQHVRELRFGTAWQYQRRAMVIPNVAGSDTIGGNGSEWFDTMEKRPAVLESNSDEYVIKLRHSNYNSAHIKHRSNMASLVGMSSCMGEKSHDQNIDICGFPDRSNYIGVMHDCDAFDDREQPKFMWDGVAWFCYIHNPHELKNRLPLFPYHNYNLDNLEVYQTTNSLCYPTTIRITDASDRPKELEGRHIRGHQGVKCMFKAESYERIGAF